MPLSLHQKRSPRWQRAVLGAVLCFYCLRGIAAGSPAPATAEMPEDYVGLGNPIIVNVFTRDTVHFLKVTAELKLKDANQADNVRTHLAALRHSLIMLFSDKAYFELTTVAGKTKLRTDALETVRKVMKEQTGDAVIDDIFFTSLVLQ